LKDRLDENGFMVFIIELKEFNAPIAGKTM